jgi:hypothetical protein
MSPEGVARADTPEHPLPLSVATPQEPQMSHLFDPTWLLLIPFLIIVMFTVWTLWNFSAEIRIGKRRRVRSTIYGHQVLIYSPEKAVLRFTRTRDKEAA